MNASQVGRSSAPIVVDRAFLGQIESLCAFVAEANVQAALARFNVSTEEASSELPDQSDYERHVAIRKAKAAIEEAKSLTLTWEYEDSRSYQVDSFSLLLTSLERGSGDIKKISIATAYGKYNYFSIDLQNEKLVSTAWFKINGDAVTVDHIHLDMQRRLKDAEAPHPYLHGWPMNLAIRGGFGLATFLSFIYLCMLAKPLVSSSTFDLTLSSWTFPVFAVVFFLTSPLVAYVKRAYPRCTFEFGAQTKRAAARRTAIAMVSTAIIIPIVLAAAGLT